MIFSKRKKLLKLPKLHAPVLSMNDTVVTVDNPASNGAFAEKWELYKNNNPVPIAVADLSNTEIDVSAFVTEDVNNTYVAKLIAESWLRSDASNEVGGVRYYPLSVARSELAAASVGDYVIFGGGVQSDGTYSSAVDAYNSDYVRVLPASLSVARSGAVAVSVYDYVLFVGGYNGEYLNTVDAYSRDLTLVSVVPLDVERSRHSGVEKESESGVEYADILFGENSSGQVSGVETYNETLAKISHTYETLDNGVDVLTAVAGNYVIAYFGWQIAAYDEYYTEYSFLSPSYCYEVTEKGCAVSLGDVAVFSPQKTESGGDYNYFSVVDADSVLYELESPVAFACSSAVTRVNDVALFAGGIGENGNTNSALTVDANGTISFAPSLSNARGSHAGASVNNNAFFAGGIPYGNSASVEIYTSDLQHILIS